MPLIIPRLLADADNVHRDGVLRHFGTLAGAEPPASPDLRFLFVCFTHRCGSNYLCHALASGGVLGLGEEFFGAETIVAECVAHGIATLADYLGHIMAAHRRNGWLVAKLLVEHLAMFTEIGWLDRILPQCRFIVVERADVLAQAISLAIALQNERWTTSDPPRVADADLRYDRTTIAALLDYIVRQRAMTSRYLGENGIMAYPVTYEHFVRDPQAWAPELSRFLGIPALSFTPEAIPLERQGSGINAAWRARYLATR